MSGIHYFLEINLALGLPPHIIDTIHGPRECQQVVEKCNRIAHGILLAIPQ